jgi:phosphomannomutase
MISVSGVRGIVGDSLTPDVVSRFSAAFGTYCRGGTVVIGRDARPSGPMVRDAVLAGLRSAGCSIVDLGIAATPTVQFAVQHHGATGGVAITASHNPIQWNAMKFIGPAGVFLNGVEARRLGRIYEQDRIRYARWDGLGTLSEDPRGADHHVDHIMKVVDSGAIMERRPAVAIDCCNSAASRILPMLLERLGCEVIKVNCDLDGTFPRGPEPTAENLEGLCESVRSCGADAGFATDPDGDRISIVTDEGVALGEECSVTLATEIVLRCRQGPVVANVATTKAVEDVARRHGCKYFRAPVGEVNVVEKMKEVAAVIGGEGNGGVINPAVQYARDGPAAMALFLEGISTSDTSMSDLAGGLPEYHMVKVKIPCEPSRTPALLEGVRRHFEAERIDLTDGIRVDRDSSWIYVRKSGTEPIVRVICEARTREEALGLAGETEDLVRHLLCR